MNHNDIDHSGALPELMREIPDTPIYCTANGKKIIQGHYHHPEWNFVTVKTGDTLDLGGSRLIFVEAPMLHWPDTMWNSTRKMAEAIADGIRQADPAVRVKLMNSAKRDKNDVVTEVFRSKAVLVGSPTTNNGYLFSIGGILEMMKGLKFKKKKAAAFGSYGWSGEAVKQLTQALGDGGFEVVNEGHRALWIPDEAEFAACREYGKRFAETL